MCLLRMIQKLLLNHFKLIITRLENHLQTYKTLINLLYNDMNNDMNNLTSIFRFSTGPKSSNNDIKALSSCNNQFSFIFITLAESYLRRNE